MAAKVSQADLIYEDLRDRLTRGAIPVGRRLVEQQLAAEFQTSRTPREALRRLEGDGHLTRDPSGGMRPGVPSVRAMRDLYDVRLAIEDLVVRRAVSSGDRGRLDELQQEWLAIAAEHRRGWLENSGSAFVHRDESFHEHVALSSGNDFATELLHEISDRIRILRPVSAKPTVMGRTSAVTEALLQVVGMAALTRPAAALWLSSACSDAAGGRSVVRRMHSHGSAITTGSASWPIRMTPGAPSSARA